MTKEFIVSTCQKKVDEFNAQLEEFINECSFGDDSVLADEEGIYYSLRNLKLRVFKNVCYLQFDSDKFDPIYGKFYTEKSEPVYVAHRKGFVKNTQVAGGFNEFMRMFRNDMNRARKMLGMSPEDIDKKYGV